MSAHTPGPWFVPVRTGTQYVEARIGGGWLQEVAACGPTEKPEEQKANARLISQAPAMLEALERLLASDDAHATIHADDGDDVARMLEYAAAFDNARAVIRAAKGET